MEATSFVCLDFVLLPKLSSQHSDVELMLLLFSELAAELLLLFAAVDPVPVWPLGGEVGCREDPRVIRSSSADASVRKAALTGNTIDINVIELGTPRSINI